MIVIVSTFFSLKLLEMLLVADFKPFHCGVCHRLPPLELLLFLFLMLAWTWPAAFSYVQANKLLFKAPESVLHSEPTAAKALQWCLKAQALRVNVSKDLLDAVDAKTATSADSKKSPFKVLKALAMLPIIILCYTVLFYKTVSTKSMNDNIRNLSCLPRSILLW